MKKEKRNNYLFLIIGIVIIIIIIIIFFVISNNNNNDNSNNNEIIDNGEYTNIKEDIKKDDEKGIVLTNLNSAFTTKKNKKTNDFTYQVTLNGKKEKLIFKNIILNNGDKEAQMTMYVNDVQIDVMKIINDSIVRTPTSIIPKFYILGNKNDEVLVLEITSNDTELPSKTYIAINNNGEVRNSFGGLFNNSISDNDFLKSIKEGKLIYDHKIGENQPNEICSCTGNIVPIVISEKRIFTVLESSLMLDSNSEYTCVDYCKK